jgi:hypothetical protein
MTHRRAEASTVLEPVVQPTFDSGRRTYRLACPSITGSILGLSSALPAPALRVPFGPRCQHSVRANRTCW